MLGVYAFTVTARAQNVLNNTVTLTLRDIPLREALDSIGKVAGVKFAYGQDIRNLSRRISLRCVGERLEAVLDKVLAGNQLSYKLVNRMVVIKNAPAPEARALVSAGPAPGTIKGLIRDETGTPLPGATVFIKGTSKGVVTDPAGAFELKQVDRGAVLNVSYTGYAPQSIPLDENSPPVLNIVLSQRSKTALDEVVVVGYGT
ncbi:MAG TPA: carboxypeptidase-like regulatory domain-containing protein, partial [Chitinophaga sp.]|uniref:STN domain-containing protein n=1 Tax=Chitinophaga sp. TaxID=1869181 RepID=UPI002F935C7F